ncbi:MAG: hypothetical protein U5N86_04000 [Planctomycetota bacterium]|nr:hypothetical protein [Planctomycetota bacterium]
MTGDSTTLSFESSFGDIYAGKGGMLAKAGSLDVSGTVELSDKGWLTWGRLDMGDAELTVDGPSDTSFLVHAREMNAALPFRVASYELEPSGQSRSGKLTFASLKAFGMSASDLELPVSLFDNVFALKSALTLSKEAAGSSFHRSRFNPSRSIREALSWQYPSRTLTPGMLRGSSV